MRLNNAGHVGARRPETFDFLGFTHKCAKDTKPTGGSPFIAIAWRKRDTCGHCKRSSCNYESECINSVGENGPLASTCCAKAG